MYKRQVFSGLGVAYEEEITIDGTTKRYYIHALGRHVASVEIDQYGAQENYYFHTDYLGSVRMISDENILVVWQKRYTPFGGDEEQSGTIENTYQFTGKGWDEDAGLFYFNARWYDADVGRFISEDPLWGNILDPQSLNRFAYGRNNPYRFTDPTGKHLGGYNGSNDYHDLDDNNGGRDEMSLSEDSWWGGDWNDKGAGLKHSKLVKATREDDLEAFIEALKSIAAEEDVIKGIDDPYVLEPIAHSWKHIPDSVKNYSTKDPYKDWASGQGNHLKNKRFEGGYHIGVDEEGGPVELHFDAWDSMDIYESPLHIVDEVLGFGGAVPDHIP